MASKLTSREADYSRWYNELVVQADLAQHSDVKGCMVIKPYGFAIWERMKDVLDGMPVVGCVLACDSHARYGTV